MIQRVHSASGVNLAGDNSLPEIAEILACGLERLLNRKSSQVSEVSEEISLYFSAFQSGGRLVPLNGERP